MNEHASPDSPGQLSLIGKLIDKYYLRQPVWLQTMTFIVFVILFSYGFFNEISGYYGLRGNLYVQTAGQCATGGNSCSTYAKYYDIRWGSQMFASNSKGEYFITISFPSYFRALPTGSHELTFIKDDKVIATKLVNFSRWGSEFADVTLPPIPASTTPSPAVKGFAIIPKVWADTLPSPEKYRVLIQGIRFSGDLQKANASIQLSIGTNNIGLKDGSHGDTPAGSLPLVAYQNLDLNSYFYFPIPSVNSLPLRTLATITLTAPRGLLQFYSDLSEEFQLPTNAELGQRLELHGSRGSTLLVRIILSSEVTIFKKSDLVDKKESLEAALLDQGLLVNWAESPQGFVSETNALWTGQAVPMETVQKLIKVVIDQDIPIKKLEYQYSFATRNLSGIQFGYSKYCDKTAPIPKPVLQTALTARTETEFKGMFTPVSSCTVAVVESKQKNRQK